MLIRPGGPARHGGEICANVNLCTCLSCKQKRVRLTQAIGIPKEARTHSEVIQFAINNQSIDSMCPQFPAIRVARSMTKLIFQSELAHIEEYKKKLLKLNVAVHHFVTENKDYQNSSLKPDVSDLYRIWNELYNK